MPRARINKPADETTDDTTGHGRFRGVTPADEDTDGHGRCIH